MQGPLSRPSNAKHAVPAGCSPSAGMRFTVAQLSEYTTMPLAIRPQHRPEAVCTIVRLCPEARQ